MTQLKIGSEPLVIGIDFDNTLAIYDELLHRLAVERGLIQPQTGPSKRLVRDSIRELPEGEIEWQKLQALVYGPRIGEAAPAPGSAEFFEECSRNGVKVNIVSHKTEFANYDETGTNLRGAALSWLEQHRFFDSQSYGLSRDDVYFESTRREKLDRIRRLACTHYIDDLEETFLEESFPPGVSKLLYSTEIPMLTPAYVHLVGDWRRITDNFFHAEE